VDVRQCSHPDGCKRTVESRGLCLMHYMRLRRTGELGPVGSTRGTNHGQCIHPDGCERSARTRGWCTMHYQRIYKAGDPGPAKAMKRRRTAYKDAPPGFWVCCECGETKALDQFHRGSNRTGRQSACKDCQSLQNLARIIGIPVAELRGFRDSQPQHCAICATTTDLVIDHDHDTGRLRGVLCRRHNSGIGMFDHDPDLLRTAADWLGIDVTASAT